MHSSRMRTARSSGRLGGGLHHAPPRADPPWEQNPPGAGTPPGADPPPEQAPPSLWTESQTPVKI